ncbi:MAG: glycosyltransferase [Verrucomicrobia bacterium]|nr:glycosyltransferase [Verrucomicrobiota bacterium]
MKVLFIGRVTPFTEPCGAVAYTIDLLRHLAEAGHDVRVLDLACADGWALGVLRRFADADPVCPRFCWSSRLVTRWCDLLARVARRCGFGGLHRRMRVPDPWGEPLSPRERFAIRRVAKLESWDVVVCNYAWLADAFDGFSSSVRKVLLTHDVWHGHLWGDSGNPWLARLDARAEHAWLDQADVVVAITDEDAADFRRIGVTSRILVAPMSSGATAGVTDPEPGRLLFVGSAYEPNVRGVDWFLDEVAPVLARAHPDHFTLHLVGTVGNAVCASGRAIPVRVHGLVDALEPHYAAASLVIAPVFEGTGLKVKVVEAVAHGKAVIATPEAVRGVISRAPGAVVVAENANAFASAVMEFDFDADARREQEHRAVEAACAAFSPEACWDPLIDAMRDPRGS